MCDCWVGGGVGHGEVERDDVSALTSGKFYVGYVASGGMDDEGKQNILDYSGGDCLATTHIFDWLLAQQ